MINTLQVSPVRASYPAVLGALLLHEQMELEPAEWSGVVNRDVQEVRRQLPSPAGDQKR